MSAPVVGDSISVLHEGEVVETSVVSIFPGGSYAFAVLASYRTLPASARLHSLDTEGIVWARGFNDETKIVLLAQQALRHAAP